MFSNKNNKKQDKSKAPSTAPTTPAVARRGSYESFPKYMEPSGKEMQSYEQTLPEGKQASELERMAGLPAEKFGDTWVLSGSPTEAETGDQDIPDLDIGESAATGTTEHEQKTMDPIQRIESLESENQTLVQHLSAQATRLTSLESQLEETIDNATEVQQRIDALTTKVSALNGALDGLVLLVKGDGRIIESLVKHTRMILPDVPDETVIQAVGQVVGKRPTEAVTRVDSSRYWEKVERRERANSGA